MTIFYNLIDNAKHTFEFLINVIWIVRLCVSDLTATTTLIWELLRSSYACYQDS